MSVINVSPMVFPHLTAIVTSSIFFIMWSSSVLIVFWRNFNSVFLCILSNALLISRSVRYTVSFFAFIVLSITVFAAKTCSVVDLPALYAACVIGVSRSILSHHDNCQYFSDCR